MEEVNITEHEARFYLDLFARCDIEKTGKVPILKATEMFRSTDIDDDVLKHIMSMAGIPLTALHMSKVQFYSCLKLIAAHQQLVPLRQELIASTIPLHLPTFNWKKSPTLNGTAVNEMSRWRSSIGTSPNLIELARLETHSDVANSDITSTDSEVEQNDTATADKKQKSHTRRVGSPEAWSTASDSPTPTNSVAERPWAQNTMWQGLICEEQRQLLGTEEELSDRHSSEEENDVDLEAVYQITKEQKEYYIKQFRTIQPDLNGLLSGPAAKVFFEKSRIPVEELRHIWQLCDVTKDGALSLAEFAAAMHLVVLRRNNIPLPPILPDCLVPGSSTFEINNHQPEEGDLLHLDDDKPDGSGSSSGSNHTSATTSSTVKPFAAPFVSARHPTQKSPTAKNATHSPSGSPKGAISNKVTTTTKSKTLPAAASKDWINQSSKEWTKFTESPTSNVSSPGPKPANFDMQRTAQAVVSDPLILHPVPLRITPVGAENTDEPAAVANRTATNNNHRKSDSLQYDGGIITIRDADAASPKQMTPHRDSIAQNDLRAIQRPQPKKIQMKNIGAIPPPPQRESLAIVNNNTNDTIDGNIVSNTTTTGVHSKKEIPPPPPPRPHRHARSSSLDLNKLKLNAPVPPEVPPRVSPQMVQQISLDAQLETVNSSFADFAHFPESIAEISQNQPKSLATTTVLSDGGEDSIPFTGRPSIPSFQSSQRSSAFEVYRKPTPRESISPPESLTAKGLSERTITTTDQLMRSSLYSKSDSKNFIDVMRHLKEQNMLLITMCGDLSEELLTVQQKKEEIKSKLDNEIAQGGIININSCKEVANQSTV